MAISNGVITVAATATAVFTGDSDGAHVLVHNNAASVDMYFGTSGLSTTTGMPLAAGASLSIFVGPAETLYALVATATQTCHYLTSDRS